MFVLDLTGSWFEQPRTVLSRIAALGVLILLLQSAASAQSARQLAQKTFLSVVLLVMKDANGQPLSLGSGFFVGHGIIATNLHVVRGASTGQAKLVGQADTYTISGLVAVDADADLALLKLAPHGISYVPTLELGDSNDVAVGDVVYAVGNPEGLEGTFSQGIVSGIRGTASDRVLQITAAISPGSSGGPIINSRGEVVGVAVATFSEGQNLNFAVPSSYLASLLKRMGDPRPLSSEKEVPRVPSGGSTEGVVGVEFSQDWVGDVSFALRNQTGSAVKDVHFLIVFFGRTIERTGKSQKEDVPIDYLEAETCDDVVILPNLVKRQTQFKYSKGGYQFKCSELYASAGIRERTRRVEIRVLGFKLAE